MKEIEGSFLYGPSPNYKLLFKTNQNSQFHLIYVLLVQNIGLFTVIRATGLGAVIVIILVSVNIQIINVTSFYSDMNLV